MIGKDAKKSFGDVPQHWWTIDFNRLQSVWQTEDNIRDDDATSQPSPRLKLEMIAQLLRNHGILHRKRLLLPPVPRMLAPRSVLAVFE